MRRTIHTYCQNAKTAGHRIKLYKPLAIISAMQAECAKQKNEAMIEQLFEIKYDYITL